MTKTYTVTTINADLNTVEIGKYDDKIKAMAAAKRAARTRKDCQSYGPTSLAYVGSELTAVVAW